MKKFIAILVICLLLFSSCSSPNSKYQTILSPIENREHLFYDKDTRIVYLIFDKLRKGEPYGYITPYYAPNGFPYQYDESTNELIEILTN